MVDELRNTLDLQAESIADIPIVIPFKVDDSSMLPEGKVIETLTIAPLKVGTVLRIQNLISKIDIEDLKKISVTPERPFDESAPEIMAKYTDVIVEIICTGLHDKKGNFEKYMPEFIKANCSWRDLHVILNAITFRMGVMPFTNSTTTLMMVGPGAVEMIALQENLDSWKELKKN